MRKHTRQLLFEVMRPPVLLVGFVIKTIYRTMFGWWLDPWLQRKATQSLIEDVRANPPFLFPIASVVEHPQIRVLPFDYASVDVVIPSCLFGAERPAEAHENGKIARDGSEEIDYSMEKLRPSSCLIRSVRVERIIGRCLPLWERR